MRQQILFHNKKSDAEQYNTQRTTKESVRAGQIKVMICTRGSSEENSFEIASSASTELMNNFVITVFPNHRN